jgi:5-methylcytosine-specific restriction endonuclease McrA
VGREHLPDDVRGPHFPLSTPASRVEPVAPRSFRIHFTASAELKEKLERLQALMRSSVPDGNLGQIIDRAVTEKLERLEAKRFGKTGKPRKSLSRTDTRPKSRHIPAAVRRAVERRDGGRCTYRNERGRRCNTRHDLEFHHRKPYGFGGDHSPDNLALMCRAHNALMAEHDYGKEVMWRHRRRSASPRSDRTPSVPVSRKRGHG